MKKTILVYLAGVLLFLAGCSQQLAVENASGQQPVNNFNQTLNTNISVVDETAYWKYYQGSDFNIKYPPYLSQKDQKDGVRTIVSFEGKVALQGYESLLSVVSMPNQGGLSLDEWTNEAISQSGWIKQGSLNISGQPAYILSLPESDAGSRYVFLSKDGMSIFDMTIQYFNKETTKLILYSFVLTK